jgi:hypothetical protein
VRVDFVGAGVAQSVFYYGLDDRGSIPDRGRGFFLLASAFRPTLGPTQPPVQWVPGGKARPGRDADHSPPSSAEVKNGYERNLLSPQAPPWRVAGSLHLRIDSVGTAEAVVLQH